MSVEKVIKSCNSGERIYSLLPFPHLKTYTCGSIPGYIKYILLRLIIFFAFNLSYMACKKSVANCRKILPSTSLTIGNGINSIPFSSSYTLSIRSFIILYSFVSFTFLSSILLANSPLSSIILLIQSLISFFLSPIS